MYWANKIKITIKMAKEASYRHLVRIANTDLDGRKAILVALTKIKGVSDMYANMVCHVAGVDKTHKTGDLNDNQVQKMDEIIRNPNKYKVPTWLLNRRNDIEDGTDKHLITSDLMFRKDQDIKRLKKIKCYRGFRHMDGLPSRGQKTKSNFRKNKGKVQGVKKRKGAKTGK